ncbi:MAG: N-acetyltransferase family protein [Cyanobacteria bacterium J06621_12]
MEIVNCQFELHGQTILNIFNQEIATSTALYDYEPRTLRAIENWFEVKVKCNFPIVGIEDENKILRGFATYGTFRNYAAYKYSVEHSVYVDSEFRHQGIGKRLLQELILLAQQQNYHTLIGAIDAENAVSIKLHQSLGFTHRGTIKQVGFKFGKWLDLELYQLILSESSKL